MAVVTARKVESLSTVTGNEHVVAVGPNNNRNHVAYQLFIISYENDKSGTIHKIASRLKGFLGQGSRPPWSDSMGEKNLGCGHYTYSVVTNVSMA